MHPCDVSLDLSKAATLFCLCLLCFFVAVVFCVSVLFNCFLVVFFFVGILLVMLILAPFLK